MTTLSEQQEIDFQIAYGTLFSLSLVTDYLDGLRSILATRNAKNIHSKVIMAEKVCNELKGSIKHEFMKTLSTHEQDVFIKAVEIHQELCYGLLGLDPDQQHRVSQLITKLKKERP